MSDTSRNQRRHFRLRYPETDRPTLRIGEQDFQVWEISEGGLQFSRVGDVAFQNGDKVSGSIEFHDGQVVIIAGVIGRVQPPVNIIVQLEGIDFARMVKEQLHLRKKYPDVRSF